MKRMQRKTVKTTRTKKNGQVTRLQMDRALDAQEVTFSARIDRLEKVVAEIDKQLAQILARGILRRLRQLGSDFMLNHAAFRKTMQDLEEGMPGISMPE